MFNKKTLIIISVALFILAGASSYTYFSGGGKTGGGSFLSPISNYKAPSGNGTPQEVVDTDPKTEECPLNGEMLSKKYRDKWVTRRPMGIVVENHLDARPQSGLSSADVLYEGVAEGGITRFLAVYYCKDASPVGPVRSARVHFMNFLREYGNYPLYAHVGGANCDAETGSGCGNGAPADALGLIRDLDWGLYNDLNQFSVPFPYFWRDYERLPDRATEHTVYTSSTKLWEFAKTKRELSNVDEEGVSWDETFTKWKFKDDASMGSRPSGTKKPVSFKFWNSFAETYAVAWNYDAQKNSYKRTNGGKAHIDKNTGKQLEVKNVIIVFAEETPANDDYPGGHIVYTLYGTGDALIFQDGKTIKGTWSKKDEDSRMIWYDENDKEVSLVRGQTIVELLPVGNTVSY